MTEYVKLIDSKTIEYAPDNKGSIINYNHCPELMEQDGYKPFIKTENIENSRLYKITYTETPDNIIENIEYLETEEESRIRINNKEISDRIDALIEEIDVLDKKRIRAICEPSTKNESTGETWLDYYNKQVQDIRNEINELQERIITDAE